ncbi:MAG TPA: ABC transporter permease [Microlunatus sp.]|nr:ABC transporter permease [Microlunatus sp.]
MSALGSPAALDLRPAPGAATPYRRVTAHARTETRLLLRNGEQLLLALAIPIGILVLGRVLGGSFGSLAVLAPSVLGLALWSSTFTSLAIATGFERRYGVLERLAATPLGRAGLLTGKALAVTAIAVGQVAVLALVSTALGWRPDWTAASLTVSIIGALLAAVSFGSLALLLAGRLRAEVTLALANVIYVVGLAAGGLLLPVTRYPAALQPWLELLPTAALGEILRAGATGIVLLWPLLVLAVWSVAAGLAAWKGFRWTS